MPADHQFAPEFYAALEDHAMTALRERKPFQINADGALALILQAAADRAALSASPARGEGDAPVAWPDNDPRYEIDVTYEVWCGDNLEASATDLSEARRYAAQYQPCSLLIATTYRQPVDAPRAHPTPATPAGEELREAIDWLALETANLERSGARTYAGSGVDAALANSGARLDRERAARFRVILAALQPQAVAGSCGGCGEADPAKRCIGCLHDFTKGADQ